MDDLGVPLFLETPIIWSAGQQKKHGFAGCKGDGSRRCAPVTSPELNTVQLVVNATGPSTKLLDDETILASWHSILDMPSMFFMFQ